MEKIRQALSNWCSNCNDEHGCNICCGNKRFKIKPELEAELKAAEEALKMQSKLCTENSSLLVKLIEKDYKVESLKRTVSRVRNENEKLLKVLETAEEALEKQTAKKPLHVDIDCSTFECPECSMVILCSDDMESHKYCLNCGQKLSWED